MTFAHVVEWKGPVDSTTRRLVADLDWLGLRRLVFKSDQEPAIRESMPTVEFVMEESPVEEHQSNGTIEVTVSFYCGQFEVGVSRETTHEKQTVLFPPVARYARIYACENFFGEPRFLCRVS